MKPNRASSAGGAIIVGAADGSTRAVGNLGGEASGRRAVVLSSTGDGVSWVVQPNDSGANAFVLRFSIPDASGGGGASGSLELTIKDAKGTVRLQQPLQLTSRYSWLYGAPMDGTKLFKVPAHASQYGKGSNPSHLYDEIQLKLATGLQPGDTISLAKPATASVPTIAVDFIDLETVPQPKARPAGFISLTDPRCGAIASDLRHTGSVFDGADDSSYGTTFNSVLGNNPFNPPSFAVIEKNYYSTNPATDALQDNTPNASTGGLSMFNLADHNFQSLKTCLELATSSGNHLTGVYIPAGRFYIRGHLEMPSNISLAGAGMWYSKFSAVDTAPPERVNNRGQDGIASQSGNFVITGQPSGSSRVILSGFPIFGNVTQRDTVDTVIPDGIHGQFNDSVIDSIWVEHAFSGIKLVQNSNSDRITHFRVRNTFADGIALYGSTSHSSIEYSSARSTGDDGFALWSQGKTADSVAVGNSVSHSVASLQWFGNGFAIYGGTGMSISQSAGADVLNFSCLRISTFFVPPDLPAGNPMSANASTLDLNRCGGSAFNRQHGAVELEATRESLAGITLNQLHIANPTNEAIRVRASPMAAARNADASVSARLQDISNVNAPACAIIDATTNGTLEFSNVCQCAGPHAAPAACALTTDRTSRVQVTRNICSATDCVGH